jgi:protein-S-isoprenylcysteine O-methyltransferase Ste14
VLAEENFLRNKFGADFDQYCSRVNRWAIRLGGIGSTISQMQFNYKRWLLKEYNTLWVWLVGIVAILLFKYPQIVPDQDMRLTIFAVALLVLGVLYLYVRYLKKSGKMTDQMS